jgi:hypothetical protein
MPDVRCQIHLPNLLYTCCVDVIDAKTLNACCDTSAHCVNENVDAENAARLHVHAEMPNHI